VVKLIVLNYSKKNNNISITIYKQLAEDISWRVRYYFCDKLNDVRNYSLKIF
jgi:hypothetical protein